jgi:hypothetical protein
MVIFELSPEDVLTFDVEDISDTMQSSIALSCSNTTDNSLVLYAVSSNPPFRYSITPDTGILLMSEPCVMSVTLSNSELGLVHFLSNRDIFDKKKGQKVLRFFAAGFAGMEDALCHWAAVAKCTTKPIFGQLFGSSNSKDEKFL